MTNRNVIVHRGHRFGWWVEGRKANGKLFMKTWWPTEGPGANGCPVGGRAR